MSRPLIVKLEHAPSNEVCAPSGVQQDSVIGSILFLVIVNCILGGGGTMQKKNMQANTYVVLHKQEEMVCSKCVKKTAITCL